MDLAERERERERRTEICLMAKWSQFCSKNHDAAETRNRSLDIMDPSEREKERDRQTENCRLAQLAENSDDYYPDPDHLRGEPEYHSDEDLRQTGSGLARCEFML